jgi:mRNA-degrading endonuclease toxin of MazEF toxin-antitoxin module
VGGTPETPLEQSGRRRPDQETMKRGDVLEVDWPFSDRTRSKTRPAVVVQADFLNGIMDDTILVQITLTRHGIPGTEVEVDPQTEPGSGLSKVCYVCCTKLLTLDQTLVLPTIASLPDVVMQQIESCLKTVQELPQAGCRGKRAG